MLKFKIPESIGNKGKEFLVDIIERSFIDSKVSFDKNKLQIDFAEDIDCNEITSVIKQLIFVAKNINRDVLFKNNIEITYNENPQSYLEISKDVIRIARGMYLFQGTFWKIFNSIHDLVKGIARKYNAIEQEYPTLWPIDLYKKINYFSEFPHQVILATSVKQDYSVRKQFAERYTNLNKYESVTIDSDHLEASSFGLQSAVCDCCYYALSNETVPGNKVYTSYNKVFRNEYSKRDSLDRLVNFSMREIMFVGDETFVLTMRQHMIDEMIELLKLLKISSCIETANDPFFSNDSAMKTAFQYSSRLKYELLARLNFANEDLAIGSINHHLDFFGRAFNICLPDGSYVHSGCVGIGFERIVYALYCQYGHNTEMWPESLRQTLKLI